ncbi:MULTISPECIES: hypothetical protein [Streptomyces]|uniref:hypothetical protein n=1 Tax=Streptomyces TaxID=1883 RepID=UPI001C8B1A61|nr:hypothetical protein [Streptomyces lateritius]MBX9427448.1 hypothetical protein [Streptomyces lateritius]
MYADTAQRYPFNHMIGQLCHCLKQGTAYDESLAFGHFPRSLSLRLETVSGE